MDDGINVTTYLPNRPWNYEESSYDRTHTFAANYSWESPIMAPVRIQAFRKLLAG